jgi:phage terminase small subunit
MSEGTQDKEKKYTRKELEKKLTPKEKIFCHQYIKHWNGARAARSAGYSEKAAKETAYVLLTKSHIEQFIEFIKNEIAQNLGLSKELLIQELQKIAFSSFRHIHNTWISREQFEDLKETNPDILDCIQEITTRTETMRHEDGELKDHEFVKIKLYDKKGAIADILKAMGWNEPEQININLTEKKVKKVEIHKADEKTTRT